MFVKLIAITIGAVTTALFSKTIGGDTYITTATSYVQQNPVEVFNFGAIFAAGAFFSWFFFRKPNSGDQPSSDIESQSGSTQDGTVQLTEIRKIKDSKLEEALELSKREAANAAEIQKIEDSELEKALELSRREAANSTEIPKIEDSKLEEALELSKQEATNSTKIPDIDSSALRKAIENGEKNWAEGIDAETHQGLLNLGKKKIDHYWYNFQRHLESKNPPKTLKDILGPKTSPSGGEPELEPNPSALSNDQLIPEFNSERDFEPVISFIQRGEVSITDPCVEILSECKVSSETGEILYFGTPKEKLAGIVQWLREDVFPNPQPGFAERIHGIAHSEIKEVCEIYSFDTKLLCEDLSGVGQVKLIHMTNLWDMEIINFCTSFLDKYKEFLPDDCTHVFSKEEVRELLTQIPSLLDDLNTSPTVLKGQLYHLWFSQGADMSPDMAYQLTVQLTNLVGG